MNTYLLEPRDPLLVRDGRPFTAGGHARALPFVPSTTLSGLVRTLAGSDQGVFNSALAEQVRTLAVQGPVLRDAAGELHFPAPLDALLLKTAAGHPALRRLLPTPPASPVFTDLSPSGLLPLALEPGTAEGKPDDMPPFWHWTAYQRWLLADAASPHLDGPLGLKLHHVERMHVSIDESTGTAREGALFGTSSLDFQDGQGGQLGLLFRTEATLTPGTVPFGGERRLSRLSTVDAAFPACPDEVVRHIRDTGCLRLILVTPAIFEQGWHPTRLLDSPEPVSVELCAAAVGRPTVLSGWDLQRGQPKPTRRLAPAGSVYFLKLGGTPDQRQEWAERHWLTPVSDHDQDCRDGLGLAALGIWRPS